MAKRGKITKSIAVKNGVIGVKNGTNFEGHTNFTIEVNCAARTPA